jgi:hypothetical protein
VGLVPLTQVATLGGCGGTVALVVVIVASVLAALADLEQPRPTKVQTSTNLQSYWFWVGHCMALVQ